MAKVNMLVSLNIIRGSMNSIILTPNSKPENKNTNKEKMEFKLEMPNLIRFRINWKSYQQRRSG